MYGSVYRHLLLPFFDRVIKGRQTLAHWRAAEESQWWERSKLEVFQLQALRGLLQHAQTTCSYYHETWKTLGLNPHTITGFEDFHRWPLITRETIRQNRLRMRTTRPVKLLSKATGGSSGEPLQFDLDSGSNDRRTAMMFRGYGWAGGQPGTKQLFVWGSHVGKVPAWKKWKSELHHRFDRHLILSCFEFTPEKMQRHVARWNRYRPAVVVAYTNPLYEFARFCQQAGYRPVPPKSIIVGAEKLHDFQRATLQEVFGAPVYETYGSREFMLIGAECEQHAGLHLTQENLLVEILDDDGRPTPAGQEGNVVVTDLFNYGMPFVRYVNGDRAVAGFPSCACGRGLPLLTKVVGRQLDTLTMPDGRKVPGEFFPHLIKEFPCVRRFQVVQDASDRITLRLIVDGGFTLADHELLLQEVRRGIGPTAHIQIDLVNEIALTNGGKHRVVVHAV